MDPRRPPASVVLPSQAHQVHHSVQGYSHQQHHPALTHQHHSHASSQQQTTSGSTGLEAYKTTDYTTTTNSNNASSNCNTAAVGGSGDSSSALAVFDASTASTAGSGVGGHSCHRDTGSSAVGVIGSTGGIDLLRGTTSTGASNSIGATHHHNTVGSGVSGSIGGRQPLSDTTGNAQHQHHHHQDGNHHHSSLHSHHNHHHGGGTNNHHHHQHHTVAPHHHYPAGQHQLPSLTSTRACLPSAAATSLSSLTGPLAPPPPTIPTPPILPTQTLGSNLSSTAGSSSHHHSNHHVGGGSSSSSGHHVSSAPTGTSGVSSSGSAASNASAAANTSLRLRRHQVMIQRRNRNPIYDCPEFAQYRMKQKEKDKQVWPDVLEHAFLDALLMVLHMGRRKFWMHNKQHGRNMIISEYIWLAWVATLPPGSNPKKCLLDEKLPDDTKGKFHDMYRKRKQVSSHIQVLKGFFRFIWAYHFFFSKGKEEGSKDKNKQPAPNRWYKENTDQRCFKGDPVLSALEARRLPSVRPNYEYFRQLLAMDAKVQVRPATCWMYVANSSLRDQTETATWFSAGGSVSGSTTNNNDGRQEDGGERGGNGNGNGNGHNNVVNTYHATKGLLFREDYPHRYAFNNCPPLEESPWTAREREVRLIRRTLLHEYTWPLKQTESSSVREVCDEWETEHPDLHDILQQVIDQHDLNNAHAQPVSQLCDIIHVDVTFDIHRVHTLPDDSSFEWMFKINVAQPGLAGHDWRVRTWLERPAELSRNQGKGSTDSKGRSKGHIVSFRDDKRMMNEFTHVRGCHDDNPHCDCRNRQSGNVWLVPIPAKVWAESLGMCAQFPRYLVPKRRGTSRTKKEDEMPESDTVTQMDLMRGTAMFQELWSSPPVAPGSLEQSMWTRRAVILWTFNTIHFFDKDSNLCETPAGTAWRFLSAVDPLMPIHQERTLLQDDSPKESSAVSPSPMYQPLLNSHLTDNLSSVWANSNNVHLNLPSTGVHSAPSSMPVSPMPSYGASSLHTVHGSFANGLVTPPPTAALLSNHVFEGPPSLVHSQDLASQHMGYLPSSSIDTKSSFVSGDSFDTNPYLHGTANNTFYEEVEDDDGSDTTVQGEQTDLAASFGAHQWPHLNNDAHAANNAVTIDWNNHGLQSLSMIAEEVSNGGENKTTTSFEDDVQQHLQHAYDPYAHLRTETRERRVQPLEGFLRHDLNRLRDSSYDRRGRQNSTDDAAGDVWTTAAAAASNNCDEATDAHNYGQDSSTHLSQSTGSWNDEMSQMHHAQPHRNDGLSMGETRSLQDFGPASLSPLLNRKRGRDEDSENEGSHRYSLGPMPSYLHRDSSRYAPSAMMDRQEGHNWP